MKQFGSTITLDTAGCLPSGSIFPTSSINNNGIGSGAAHVEQQLDDVHRSMSERKLRLPIPDAGKHVQSGFPPRTLTRDPAGGRNAVW